MTRWLLAFGVAAAVAFCQAPVNRTAVRKGTVQRIKVHGKALEGNLAGDTPDRDVSVNLAEVIERAMVKGDLREMIVVMPNAYTRYQGSMYSNSATTGNWEDCVARELVAYIDGHYRTVAEAEGRGLAGHSMGGYGAARVGMRHPDVFSSVYLLSPCCMVPSAQPGRGMPAAEAIQS